VGIASPSASKTNRQKVSFDQLHVKDYTADMKTICDFSIVFRKRLNKENNITILLFNKMQQM